MQRNIIIIILVFFSLQINAQDFQRCDMRQVGIFPVGNGKGELANDIQAPVDTGPTAMAFDTQGNLYISDILNRRLEKFDSYLKYVGEYKNGVSPAARHLFITEKGEFLIYNYTTFAVDDKEGNKKILIDLLKSPYKNQITYSPTFVYVDNYIFSYLKDESLLAFENPGIDMQKNLEKLTIKKKGMEDKISDKVRMNILESAPDTKSFSIEKNNRIIIDDKIKTQDFKDFTQYWGDRRALKKNNIKTDKQNKNLSVSEEKHYDGFTDDYLKKLVDTKFLGYDKDENIYWHFTYNKILIFNNLGYAIYAIQYDQEKTRVFPTIHPSGDIYFLGYDGQKNYLYKIARTW